MNTVVDEFRRPGGSPPEGRSGRAGFTLVELVIALIVLSIGMLGMAATTGHVVRSITLSDLNTERAAALQSAVEQVRATPFGSLANGADTVGIFEVAWAVSNAGANVRNVEIITVGPGLTSTSTGPRLLDNVPDTFNYVVVRP